MEMGDDGEAWGRVSAASCLRRCETSAWSLLSSVGVLGFFGGHRGAHAGEGCAWESADFLGAGVAEREGWGGARVVVS
jgi:hypothetical protein